MTIKDLLERTLNSNTDSSDDNYEQATGDDISSDSESNLDKEDKAERRNGNTEASPNHVYQNNVR